jgi:hypothetical protein
MLSKRTSVSPQNTPGSPASPPKKASFVPQDPTETLEKESGVTVHKNPNGTINPHWVQAPTPSRRMAGVPDNRQEGPGRRMLRQIPGNTCEPPSLPLSCPTSSPSLSPLPSFYAQLRGAAVGQQPAADGQDV